MRISDLPWAQLPQIEERDPSDTNEASFFVPPNSHADQLGSRFQPGWSGPDLGAPPTASAADFYALLEPLDLTERPVSLRRPLATAYLLRHRDAERIRCQILGHAVPDWLTVTDRLESDIDHVLQRWGFGQ